MLADPTLVGARGQLRRAVAGDCATSIRSSPTRRSSPTGTRTARRHAAGDAAVLRSHAAREPPDLASSWTRRYTFLNERLAKHYGIEGVKGPEFRRVELTTDQRGGILSHASVLTVSSYPTRTSVVIRGKYMLNNILGSPPPPAAARRSAAGRSRGRRHGSLRQQMEKHRADAMCASCHNKMDPLGLRPRELRRHRQLAHHGRQVPGGFHRHPAQRQNVLQRRRRCAPC